MKSIWCSTALVSLLIVTGPLFGQTVIDEDATGAVKGYGANGVFELTWQSRFVFLTQGGCHVSA
jgi:hypothetical protein